MLAGRPRRLYARLDPVDLGDLLLALMDYAGQQALNFNDHYLVDPPLALGGHCGNLNYRVNADAMLEFFRG